MARDICHVAGQLRRGGSALTHREGIDSSPKGYDSCKKLHICYLTAVELQGEYDTHKTAVRWGDIKLFVVLIARQKALISIAEASASFSKLSCSAEMLHLPLRQLEELSCLSAGQGLADIDVL